MEEPERGYLQFSPEEVRIGIQYALQACNERLMPTTLFVLAMTAGPLMQREHCPANHAADRALNVYVKAHGPFDLERRRAYKRAVCKMLAERNPRAKARRKLGLGPRYKPRKQHAA